MDERVGKGLRPLDRVGVDHVGTLAERQRGERLQRPVRFGAGGVVNGRVSGRTRDVRRPGHQTRHEEVIPVERRTGLERI